MFAHSMVLLVLATFLHKQQCGDIQDWSDFGAARANNDVVEQMHSEERSGGFLSSNHCDSVNMKEHLSVMQKLQQLFDRRPRLEAVGLCQESWCCAELQDMVWRFGSWTASWDDPFGHHL